MKRVFKVCLIALILVIAAWSGMKAKDTHAKDATVRARISLLSNSEEAKAAEAALKKAEQEMDAHCDVVNIRCFGDRPSVRIDRATGKVEEDKDYALLKKNIEVAKDAKSKVDEEVFKLQDVMSTNTTWYSMCSFVSAMLVTFALGSVFKKKEAVTPEPSNNVLAQDDTDRTQLAFHRTQVEFLEQRLAARSYREPDRTVGPVRAAK